jgi:hypothetical protein
MGAVESEAWQRALMASARATYDQLSSGQVSAAASAALAWDLGPADDMEERCMHLTVLAWGYAQAELRPCTGGDVLAMQTGWLMTEELEQLDQWLYAHAGLNVEQGYVMGQGAAPMDDAAFTAVEQWAASVWLRLWDVATPQDIVLSSAAVDECVVKAAGEQLLRDDAAGYCLIYPEGYLAERTTPNTMNFVLGSIMNHTDPRLTIEIAEADGRTLAEAGDAVVAEYPGFDIARSSTTIDEVEALVLDNIPGQDLNRRVLMIHDGMQYTLFFTPLGDTDETRAMMDAFYTGILSSFRFLE